ncbi:TPA: hypothetical protein NPP44_001668 [Klebsiella pneumoniae]|uniref:hypothetical protein n=1 Tax=Klebsiella pneumoniae TaxID=573 RepID=UPI002933570C|nr:hypothetical protein [Klebsiella pneumoniae]HEC1398288.1 hypothetical protein [Klebsiella pneumoniae]
MTKPTITRERLEELAAGQSGFNLRIATHEESQELARIALSTMDSEPAAEVIQKLNGYDRPLYVVAIQGDIEEGDVLYRHAQPSPVVLVVPDEIKHRIGGLDWGWEGEFNRGWNACRAAMLQAEPVCTCPSGDGSLRWPCPVHPGSSPATSDNWKVEAEKLAEMHGMSFVLFRHGEAPQCADPTKVVISFTDKGLGHDTLPAAPTGGER